jgi:hypothetical protein
MAYYILSYEIDLALINQNKGSDDDHCLSHHPNPYFLSIYEADCFVCQLFTWLLCILTMFMAQM